MAKELSLMGQLRKEADRDFSKYLKYVNEIFEENKNLREENKKLKEENEALKEWVAKWMSYKNTYNDAIPRDENWFYKEVKPTC